MSHKYPEQCGSTNTINNRDKMRASHVSDYADKHQKREQEEKIARKIEEFRINKPEAYAKKMKQKEEAKAAEESARLAAEASATNDTSVPKGNAGKQSKLDSTISYLRSEEGILVVVAGIFCIATMLYKFHKNKQLRRTA